ncbi:MAG: cell wall-active antibiotics response protein [Acidobacteria bacterium]|jgi:predicted membrane protein|nr:cell wall-active antibiotics response protein [Acidobacteriota bacterium]
MTGQDSRPPNHGIAPRLVLGLTVMAAGLVLALDNLGFMDSSLFFRYWPLAFVILGILKLTAPPGQRSGGVPFILVGVFLLAFTSGHMNFQRLLALLLLLVGGSIAWRALRPHPLRADPRSGVDVTAILGGSKTVNSSADFQGGQALAVMGGCEVDLRKATITGDDVVLDIFAFWGGVVVQVPEDWDVDNRVHAILGGIEDKTHGVVGNNPRLILTGTVIMGGAEVKH